MERLEELYLKYGQPVRRELFESWIRTYTDILKLKLEILIDEQLKLRIPSTNYSNLLYQRKLIDLQILQESLNELQIIMTK